MRQDDSSPKVSVIMPVFNSASYVKQAIESVLSQTYSNWELIVCDDGSTDSSAQIVAEVAVRDGRVILLRNVNSEGAPRARNRCLEKASGRFIAFLDSDDVWYSNKLSLQIHHMISNDIGLSHTYYHKADENMRVQCEVRAPATVGRVKCCFANFLGCLTVIYDAEN